MTIRNWFRATFRRDVLKSVLEKDKTTIPEGNNSAHGGDFLVDAKLYEKNYRFDDDLFTHLYGLPWQRAESYRKQPEVVSALNLYAGAVADPLYATQDLKHLKECFAKFIVSLQTGGYRKFSPFRIILKSMLWTPCYRLIGIYQKNPIRSSLDERSFFRYIIINFVDRPGSWVGLHGLFLCLYNVSSFRQWMNHLRKPRRANSSQLKSLSYFRFLAVDTVLCCSRNGG